MINTRRRSDLDISPCYTAFVPNPTEAKLYHSGTRILIVAPPINALSGEEKRKWKEQVAKDLRVSSVEVADGVPSGSEWIYTDAEMFHTPSTLKDHIEAENVSCFELLVRQLRSPMGVVPFIGAGLSIPFGFDSWESVLRDAARFHSKPELVVAKIADSDLLGAADLLQQESADRFQATVAHKFGRDIPPEQTRGEAVALLPMLANGPVITTNFDHVIETAFADTGNPFKSIITGPQPDSVIGAMHRNEHALIKIHGDARDRSARVFTAEEYAEQYSGGQPNRANLAKLLHILFTNRPLLFLGCSLDKDKTLQVLARIHADLPGLAHYGVLAAPYRVRSLAERRIELADYGIFPLWYVPGDYRRVGKLLEELIQEASTRLIWKAPIRETTAVPAVSDEGAIEPEYAGEAPTVAIKRLADRIVRRKLAFLIGAGAYVEHRLTATAFYDALAEEYDIDSFARADIVQYIIDTEGRQAAWEIAKKKLVIPRAVAVGALRFIASLPKMLRESDPSQPAGQWLLTTNWDTSCEYALEQAGEPFHVLYYQADGPYMGLFFHRDPNGTVRLIERVDKIRNFETGSVVVKLDGGVPFSPYFRESVAMAPMDYSAAASRYPGAIPQAVLSALNERGLLCLGSSLEPPNVQRLVRWTAETSGDKTWAVLLGVHDDFRRHWRAAGVEVLDCDIRIFISALRKRTRDLLFHNLAMNEGTG